MLSRIQIILKSKNLSPSKFAEEIGVKRSAMSHILSGRNNPSLEFIQKILTQYQEIKADWLLFGKGQMYKDLQLFNPDTVTNQDLNKNEDDKIIPSPPTQSIKSSGKAIDKIVIFYSDKSFSEYLPENNQQ
jgi:transcriptional regulator with XRE-family HTH domain